MLTWKNYRYYPWKRYPGQSSGRAMFCRNGAVRIFGGENDIAFSLSPSDCTLQCHLSSLNGPGHTSNNLNISLLLSFAGRPHWRLLTHFCWEIHHRHPGWWRSSQENSISVCRCRSFQLQFYEPCFRCKYRYSYRYRKNRGIFGKSHHCYQWKRRW